MDEWINKRSIYTYNGMSFTLRKAGNSDTRYNMVNFKDIMSSEMSQSKKNKYCANTLI